MRSKLLKNLHIALKTIKKKPNLFSDIVTQAPYVSY